jgi:hypothetical protein
MTAPMSLKMHGLIWLDEFSGLALIAFIGWSLAIAKEWQHPEALD